jgi:hypothetical protein
MVALSPLAGAGWQFFDNNGIPLAGGKLYTYAAGTTTPLSTYTSSSGATPHSNPIVLDSAGRVSSEIWLSSSASYKFTLATASNVTLWTKDDISGAANAADLANFIASLASSTGASLVGYGDETVEDALDTLLGDRGPVLIAIAGQSNAVGVWSDGPNPFDARVKTWNPLTLDWVSGGQFTAAPWTSINPTGNSSKNNFALAAAHRIARDTDRDVYIVFDALSGQSITQWVPSTQPRYAALQTKIEAALATSVMVTAGKTEIDFLIWAQGEEDFQQNYSWYYNNLILLDKQLRAETWCSSTTPVYTMGVNRLGDRYMPQAAQKGFCYNSIGEQSPQYPNSWVYISNRSFRTEYVQNQIDTGTGSGDNSHWLGIWLWHGGYDLVAPAWLYGQRSNQYTDDGLFWGRSTGPATANDTQVVGSFSTLVSWDSRSGGALTQSFNGDGVTLAFTLDYRGAATYEVTVNGVVKATPADYTISGQTLTFVAAPSAGIGNIVVRYGNAISGAAAQGSLGWGYACFPDGNYTLAGGYKCYTDNLCSYTIIWGRDSYSTALGDYGAAFGYQNVLNAPYSFAAGRGHTVSDDYGAAVGKFSVYTTGQTDDVLFQVGNGTAGTPSNAFAVRNSGALEAKDLATYANNAAALAGGLVVGQIYKTVTGELRIVV